MLILLRILEFSSSIANVDSTSTIHIGLDSFNEVHYVYMALSQEENAYFAVKLISSLCNFRVEAS